MIAIVDYGVGNVRAFVNVYHRLNIDVKPARRPEELASASRIVLPGVGSFDHAMDQLQRSGMREVLDDLVLRQRVPVLGVCVGMQMLGHASDEGQLPGLGWVGGRVKIMTSLTSAAAPPLPHMGWNDVRPAGDSPLFARLETARFYFLHSYYFECADHKDAIASSTYGLDFACAVNSGNIFGVQFHPEKSHHYGARLLQNFAEM
jgi:glutamine amidotransferase